MIPFWHETVAPALPPAPVLTPLVMYNFLQYFKREQHCLKDIKLPGQRQAIRYLTLGRLQEAVQNAWRSTAADHGLDPTLADAWFDWPAIIEKIRQEKLKQDQEDWEMFLRVY